MAQDYYAVVRETLDDMFANIDKTKVPHGLLRDYAVDYADWDKYDGTVLADSNAVNVPTLLEIIKTLNSSSVSGFEPIDFEAEQSAIAAAQNSNAGIVPVEVLAYKYSYIRADAISGGYLAYSSNMVSDVYDCENVWVNPYLEGTIVAFSPCKNTVSGHVVIYDFSSMNHTNFNYSLEFDAGDGLGFRTLNNTGDLTAVYSDSGIKFLSLKLTAGNNVYFSRSLIYVETPRMFLSDIEAGNFVTTVDSITCSTSYQGDRPSAKISTKLAPGHTQLEKPFVIVEGFDPLILADDGSREFGFTNMLSVYSDLPGAIKDVFDIVYIDWDNSESFIQANASLLIDIIDYVNFSKSNEDEPIILMGQSMGGLIARYALRKMEMENHRHYVSVFISDDAPHLGVNVPMGAQYAIQDIWNNFNVLGQDIDDLIGFIPDADVRSLISNAYNMLNWNSSKQMLTTYVCPGGYIDNSMHESFMTEINSMGFPEGDNGHVMSRYAISNGGVNNWTTSPLCDMDLYASLGWATSLVTMLFPLLPISFGTRLLPMLIIPGTSSVHCGVEIFPVIGAQQKVYDASITFTKKLLWIANINFNLYHVQKYSPANCRLRDNNGGSYFDIQAGEIMDDIGDMWALNRSWNLGEGGRWASASLEMNLTKKIMFVPTASSLCVGSGHRTLSLSDYAADYSEPASYIDETPFHSIFIRDNGSCHIDLSGEDISNWLSLISNTLILGPSVGLDGSQYVVGGCSEPAYWATSDTSIATISQSGEISVVSPGEVSIMANIRSGGENVVLTKNIWAGFPECSLSGITSLVSPSVTVMASIPNAFRPYFQDSGITCQWGIKYGNGSISWENSNSTSFYGQRSDRLNMTVYFRMKRGDAVGNAISELFGPYFGHQFDPIIVPLCIAGDGNIYCDESSQTQEDETKSVISSELMYRIGDNIVLHSSEWLSPSQLCQQLLKEEEFIRMIRQMKPWGDEDFMMLRFSLKDAIFGDETNSFLKFVFLDD